MAFWSEKSVEPKRGFRWLLYWSGVPQFIVKSVKKPSFAVGMTKHQFLNYEFNYPGRVTWNPIDITIVDPVSPDSTKSLYAILEKSGYVIPTEYREAEAVTISKENMIDSLGGEIKLAQLGPDGKRDSNGLGIETWVIKNPLLTSVDFGNLDYGVEEMLNIQVNITYDFATIEGRSNDGQSYAGSQVWDLNNPRPGRGGSADIGDAGSEAGGRGRFFS
jgi:hypothetical protein|tara:strand:+ start:11552 stop:12205 length:654 start_codon:yes stop_codon:yes gene_type:complete